MEQTPEHVILVGPDDTLDTVLARLARAPSRMVALRVPREARVPRDIEHFQALRDAARRRNLQLRVISRVASIVGMAKIYGLEAEFEAATSPLPPMETEPPAPAPPAPPISRPASGPLTLPPATPPPPPEAPRRQGSGPLALPPTPDEPPLRSVPPAPAPAAGPSAPAEHDWLLGGLDADAMEAELAAERGQTAAPPPDLFGGARPAPAPPPPSAAPAGAPLTPLPAAPRPVPPEPPAPPVEKPRTGPIAPLPTDKPKTGPIAPLEPGTLSRGHSLPADDYLPEWLRGEPTPPAPGPTPHQAPPTASPAPPARPAPLLAHGPAPRPGWRWVVRCPHCGEDMDLETLGAHAEYREG